VGGAVGLAVAVNVGRTSAATTSGVGAAAACFGPMAGANGKITMPATMPSTTAQTVVRMREWNRSGFRPQRGQTLRP
jgi:hypothetical protein